MCVCIAGAALGSKERQYSMLGQLVVRCLTIIEIRVCVYLTLVQPCSCAIGCICSRFCACAVCAAGCVYSLYVALFFACAVCVVCSRLCVFVVCGAGFLHVLCV
jgi:hypothetical protein